MLKYSEVEESLKNNPKTWLITGVAGFIGSNLLERLLKLNQKVIGLDNFSTGFEINLNEVKETVGHKTWANFDFIHGDINNYDACLKAVNGVDYVLHQAALGSVPRSIEHPINSNNVNISGFLNVLHAAKEKKIKSFVYASSSSVYGDNDNLPKVEQNIGNPLSPYALTKLSNEMYSDVYSKVYNFHSIGLRYFNVFGKRQTPDSQYAAVIPKWISAMIKNEEVNIFGDGETSRDFCYVENVIQINILASLKNIKKSDVYNVAVGNQSSLNKLFKIIKNNLEKKSKKNVNGDIVYKDFRKGDVRHSLADISKAAKDLKYRPEYNLERGIEESMSWYINRLR